VGKNPASPREIDLCGGKEGGGLCSRAGRKNQVYEQMPSREKKKEIERVDARIARQRLDQHLFAEMLESSKYLHQTSSNDHRPNEIVVEAFAKGGGERSSGKGLDSLGLSYTGEGETQTAPGKSGVTELRD